jgi:hypothetical protein
MTLERDVLAGLAPRLESVIFVAARLILGLKRIPRHQAAWLERSAKARPATRRQQNRRECRLGPGVPGYRASRAVAKATEPEVATSAIFSRRKTARTKQSSTNIVH